MEEGQRFGRYRLERLIGSGGMGDVYEATDLDRDRAVALKLLPELFSNSDDFEERFRRESRMAARLRDPHIIPIHDYGEIDRRLYIDMRLVDNGVTLASLIRDQGPLTPERTVRLLTQISEALDAAHEASLIHRDIKPSNILVTPRDFAYVVDFGIAHATGDTRNGLTMSGSTVGTIDYMAPERFDDCHLDRRTDVYSLACLLYQCLTGRPPFEGAGLPQLMYAHVNTDPPKPSALNSRVTSAMDRVVAVGMAKSPNDRYPSAGALAEAAQHALHDTQANAPMPVAAPPPQRPAIGTAPLDTHGSHPPPPRRTTVGTAPFKPYGAYPPPHPSSTGATERPTDEHVKPPRWPAVEGGPARSGETEQASSSAPARPAGVSPQRKVVLMGAAIATAVVLLVSTVIVGVSLNRESSAAQPAATGAPGAPQQPGPVSTALPRLVNTLRVPGRPETVAVSPDGKFAYMSTADAKPNGTVHTIDTETNAIVASTPIPGLPRFVATNPTTGNVYVSYNNDAANKLEVAGIDATTRQVVKTIDTGQPADRKTGQTWLFVFAISTDGKRIYIPHHTKTTVSVLDTDRNIAIAQIPMPMNPHSVALTPDGRSALVATHASGEVDVIDTATNTFTKSIPIGASVAPHDVDVSPDGRTAHVVNFEGGTVSVVDIARNTVSATIPVGGNPQSVIFAADGRRSYVVDNKANVLHTIDASTNTITGTVPVTPGASMVALSPDGTRAYIASRDSSTITTLLTAA